ncbi:MAG: (deoxy)nucleoside triphosphate pyrophosphohydrolase [Bryobacteraceae bacterium]|nr:(deoxy)nucleoside triphosphate pyrophosphohydrolase [Bryobacteraceae bacterium]
MPDQRPRVPRRPVIKVAAGLIVRDGRILIGQRKKADSHGLKWEFPGGKIERGETSVDALARELEEELGIQARIGREVVRYTWSYPKRATILLMFHIVTEFSGDPQSLAFERIAWEPPDRLPGYDFLEGDIDFVRRLASGEFDLAA